MAKLFWLALLCVMATGMFTAPEAQAQRVYRIVTPGGIYTITLARPVIRRRYVVRRPVYRYRIARRSYARSYRSARSYRTYSSSGGGGGGYQFRTIGAGVRPGGPMGTSVGPCIPFCY